MAIFMILSNQNESNAQNNSIPDRNKIDPRYTWDVNAIYKNQNDWEADFNKLSAYLKEFKKFEGKLSSGADTIALCLDFYYSTCNTLYQKLFLYSSLNHDLDQADQKMQSHFDRIKTLGAQLSAAAAFISPEILKIDKNKFPLFISHPKLIKYAHIFDEIMRKAEHTLSKSEEEMLSLYAPIDDSFMNVYQMLTNAEVKFPTIKGSDGNDFQLTHGRYYNGMFSLDRDFRKRAYQGIYIPFTDYKNTLATLYTSSIKSKIFNAQARKYTSTLEAALNENNIPVEVYTNLIKTVNENISVMHRWTALKKKILKLKDFHPYDTYVTLFPAEKKDYTYDQAIGIIIGALAIMGDDYIRDMKMAIFNRRIDVYETKGKATGAYSSGSTPGVEPYILLNWSGDLNDVFTLAHELGHNMHSHYTISNQEPQYADYPIFLAEIASTTNEALLLDYLLKNAKTKSEKLSLMEKALNNFQQTFFRQCRFAEFEMLVQSRMEKGEVFTAETLANLFGELYQKQWGPEMTVDNEEKYSWSRVHHFFYNFYVFQYSTGIAAAQTFATAIETERGPAIDRYMNFLKAGNSDYAVRILMDAGVDMSSPQPIISLIQKMNDILNQMEALIDSK
ncbi:MAG: oligoendopeptidase F [Candidatus Kapabacteria bacterium]|nr:oligoendopeptidase F [Candidatus Kapabacteria bacterium]